MKKYLLEIGCEELPPEAVNTAISYLKEDLEKIFENFFGYKTEENISVFGTPRRIGFLISNLMDKEPPEEKTILGPPAKVGIDRDGNFTKAALAFASKHNIPVEKLKIIENEKGRYIGATLIQEGRDIRSFIAEIIPDIISKIPFPKLMRWNDTGFRFSRPIRWIVSLLNDEIVTFSVAGIYADRYTYLHRFMTHPLGRGEKKEIKNADSYYQIMKLGYIIPKYDERKEAIRTQLTGLANSINADPVVDEDLMDEVTNLTEFPVGILGDFSPEYLILPKEVIITVCKVHQRFFNFEKDGKLLPKFLAFSNTAVKDREKVKNGYEKVLKARLEDALFFYEEDLKHSLEDFCQGLEGIQFHHKLGSMLEKVKRNGEIAVLLSRILRFRNIKDLLRANRLSKCDLLTEMVKEFDELQGIMGMHYALKQGEKPEVAKAIYEHYLPKTSDDNLPETEIGTILSLSDKLDTVISFISIGEKPKATADPFGIRRNSIGIIRLLVEKQIDLDLKKFLQEISKESRKVKLLRLAEIEKEWKVIFDEKTTPEILDFMEGRFTAYMKEKGFDTDIINSVLSVKNYNFYRNYLKIRSIQELKENPEFSDIMTVFKRVGRIIPEGFKEHFDPNTLLEKEEKDLYKKYTEINEIFSKNVEDKRYSEALNELLKIKPFIDRFFDNVMVMTEDKKLRENRLSLMKLINSMFRKIADFTKITT